MRGYSRKIVIPIASLLLSLYVLSAQIQTPSQRDSSSARIAGTVRDSVGNPVPEASVLLEKTGGLKPLETKTDVRGNFLFSSLSAGTYVARAEKSGNASTAVQPVTVSVGEQKHLDFVLVSSAESKAARGSQMMAETIQLDNKTEFEVAGVTDWTAAGGHGSDTNLRTSETLARDTRALQNQRANDGSSSAQISSQVEQNLRAGLLRSPEDFALNHQLGEIYFRSGHSRDAIPLLQAAYRANPSDYSNGYDLALAYQAAGDLRGARDLVREMSANSERAELHRLLGDIDEQMQDPLSAVREYERATQMEASEPNYFAWAVELLVHRAIEPAIEVFTHGSEKYPTSERMLEGLGAGLYASGSYQKAAEKLCAASDLKPLDASPYLFLAKMQQSAPQPLPCAEEKLARFVHDQPGNALANYDYAVALRKREQGSGKVATSGEIESLLQKAIALDHDFADAYLELGVLYSARGDFARAIAQYQKALDENPNLTEAHFRLGQAYKRTGEQEKAREQFQAYERTSKTEAAAIDARRREVRQFVIVLKQQPERPTAVEP